MKRKEKTKTNGHDNKKLNDKATALIDRFKKIVLKQKNHLK